MRRARASKIRRRVGEGLDPNGPIEDQRAAFARLLELTRIAMPSHSCEARTLGSASCLLLSPAQLDAGASARTVLYIHGGGYSLGAPEVQQPLAARIAAALGRRVWMPRYRLAPEHPCPAALTDLLGAWAGLSEAQQREAVLVGDSAGAGLVLRLAQALRERGVQGPAGLVLMSPWIDLSVSGPSIETNAAHEILFTRAGLELMARRYAGTRAVTEAEVSPLFGEFDGLPPMLIQAGAQEMLLDDSTRAAARAQAAGVEVELQIYAGQAHVFQATPMLEASSRAIAAIATWVAALDQREQSTLER